jgi:hypothetical protein
MVEGRHLAWAAAPSFRTLFPGDRLRHDWLERVVSSVVDDARRFDSDVAQLRRVFTRLKRIIATIQRDLDKRERGRHRSDVIFQTYVKQHRRLRMRQRELWLCKLVPLSLVLLVLATCRAALSGALWLLHYSSRLILVRVFTLAGTTLNSAADMHWAKCASPRIAFPIAAITLGAIGAIVLSRPMTPVEAVLPIIPDSQNPATLTVARKEPFPEHAGTIASPSLAPGFARVLPLEALPEPLPASGKDIAGIVMTSLPAPKATYAFSDAAPIEATEPRRPPRAEAPANRPTKQTKSLATTEVATAPTVPSSSVDELASEQPEGPQGNPARADRRQDFVPHTFW